MASRNPAGVPTDIRSKIKNARQAAPDYVVPQSEPGLPHPVIRDPLTGYPKPKPTPKPSKHLQVKHRKSLEYGPKGYKRKASVGKGKVYITPTRKTKPKASKIGTAKGEWRKAGEFWKMRRFTREQRMDFRKKRQAVFGGPDDGRQ